MAHIRTRTLRDGSASYTVRWIDPAGNEQCRQFSRANSPRPATDAKAFKVEVEAELQRGTYVDPSAGQITFRAYAAEWLASQAQRPTSMERLERILRVHIDPLIGTMRMGAIRRRDIQAMVSALRVKPVGGPRAPGATRPALSASYVVNIYECVAGIFRVAVLDKVIPATPCEKIKLPKATKSEIVIPTPEQVRIAAGRVSPRLAALVHLASKTGLRFGEASGLDLDRLQMLPRTVRVDRQVHVPDSGPHRYGPPKTDNGYRAVPLPASAAHHVARHLERYGTGVDGLVFTGRTHNPLRRKAVAESLGPVLRSLGLPPRSGMHVFRHFYASGLIAQGLDVATVAKLLGDTQTEVLATYSHLWHDHADRARTAVEAAFPMGHGDREETVRTVTGPRLRGRRVTRESGPVVPVAQVKGL